MNNEMLFEIVDEFTKNYPPPQCHGDGVVANITKKQRSGGTFFLLPALLFDINEQKTTNTPILWGIYTTTAMTN